MNWVARLPRTSPETWSPPGWLRTTGGVEVAFAPDAVWLRGPERSEPLELRLRTIPDLAIFERPDHRRLRPVGWSVATDLLPTLEFRPLMDACPLAFRPQAPNTGTERVPLRLMRSHEPVPAGLLETEAALWIEFAETAPSWRLERTRFVATHSRVRIAGDELPPLPGQRYSLRHGIAVPLGWRIAPIEAPQLLASMFALSDETVAVFPVPEDPDAPLRYDRHESSDWIRSDRSAVRTTWPRGVVSEDV
ncbi:MAG: hypothetical protein AAF488_04030 [Planctomycetota bacterium]